MLNTVAIFSLEVTPRLTYILNEMFNRRLGLQYVVYTNQKEWENAPHPKINYSNQAIETGVCIKPSRLLFETGIDASRKPLVNKDDIWKWTIRFEQESFDPIAGAFYLLSRYEEYQNDKRDGHGRFSAADSLAQQHGFLAFPLVEHWCDYLGRLLKEQEPQLQIQPRTYKVYNTIDIDFAYLYKGLPIWRWTGKLFKSLVSLKWHKIIKQVLVTCGLSKDPYDTYDVISRETTVKPHYFLLMANYGGVDHNINPKSNAMQKLMQKLNSHAINFGIHPSYRSNNQSNLLEEEKKQLEHLIGRPVNLARQHFLKLAIPTTYHQYTQQNITKDFSFGYADAIGFRASTCVSFRFYDLTTEQVQPLEIYTTNVMDVTLKHYLQLSPDEALKLSKNLTQVIKQYGGNFVCLWHNNSLSETDIWKNWKQVYIALINHHHD